MLILDRNRRQPKILIPTNNTPNLLTLTRNLPSSNQRTPTLDPSQRSFIYSTYSAGTRLHIRVYMLLLVVVLNLGFMLLLGREGVGRVEIVRCVGNQKFSFLRIA